MVHGIEDLRTPLSKIIQLDKELRGTLSGFMMPAFVVDLPGGGGKRLVSTHKSYDEATGVAVYEAPGLPGDKGRRTYEYHDPKPISDVAVEELRQEQEQALEQNITLQDFTNPTVRLPGPSMPLRQSPPFDLKITVPRRPIPANIRHAGIKPEDLALQFSVSNYQPSSSAAAA